MFCRYPESSFKQAFTLKTKVHMYNLQQTTIFQINATKPFTHSRWPKTVQMRNLRKNVCVQIRVHPPPTNAHQSLAAQVPRLLKNSQERNNTELSHAHTFRQVRVRPVQRKTGLKGRPAAARDASQRRQNRRMRNVPDEILRQTRAETAPVKAQSR